jgi:type I restriction enzyme R subunit
MATKAIQDELERLRKALEETRSQAEAARVAAEEAARERLTAEERARKEHEERALWEQLAVEVEQAKSGLVAQLEALQAAAAQAPAQATEAIVIRAEEAAQQLDLDEATTRTLIDRQLRAYGWEADTETLRYGAGTRPAKGHNVAIAEWPTKNGPADYALFVGLQCVAVVEAKRHNTNVSSAIDQAQRYSRGFRFEGGAEAVGGPWPDTGNDQFLVPFVFSANGRAYLKQIETESGIWFRDARKASNHRRALADWPTPDGLKGMLEIDAEAAHAELKSQPIEFAFPLRDYQRRAIQSVEARLAAGNRGMLIAMATGTGKTRLAIALLYRLLAAKRFRRVCFVVDRNALGTQAIGEFQTTRMVTAKTFADIFGLKADVPRFFNSQTVHKPRVIQGLVQRVLPPEDRTEVPPVDQYDLMVVDECHRGYLLDREMSDAELSFRDQKDYVSKYRRVLEHFDAVKIGLTATPALHTVQIFGEPVFTYSYREAVIDGHLVDHEPPVQITTALAQAGITFGRGEQIERIDARTGRVDLAHTPDELKFEVEEFNKRVVTVAFNRAVAAELAAHIDPNLPGKTLIFAATDARADIVVNEVKKAFREAYGEVEDAAVRKVTGSVDRVGDLIKAYRNDALPKIAVTVDLLTTGIAVPKIQNLVFLRRVNSRILYEQMLGRATRRCDEIGKETFRIFDAVDLYPHLQDLTEMKPVVVDPATSLAQLFEEFARVQEEAHREAVRDQILVKVRRRLRKLTAEVRARFEAEAGEPPEATLERFTHKPTADTAAWLQNRPNLGRTLDWDPNGNGPRYIPISHHPDQVISVTPGYGSGQRPEDFLNSFTAFVRDNVNKIAALSLVVQRPRELTRAGLKALRLELDALGYSETALRRAWSEARNEDIAASIIGFIRQAAIGDALTPFDLRVRHAMQRILAAKSWTPVQKQWLKRFEEQIIREVVVDRAALDQEPFSNDGGFARLNKIFGGQLETVLADINEHLWAKVA